MSQGTSSHIVNHLTTTLLSLEIDVAQLETKVFLLFNDLRELYGRAVSSNPPPPAEGSAILKRTPESPPPASVVQSHALKVLDEISEVERLEEDISEAVKAVRIQLDEGAVEAEGWTELGKQTKGVIDDLKRARNARRKLENWADEIYFGCHFNEMVGEACRVVEGPNAGMFLKRGDSLKLIVGRPLSLLARCPSQSSVLTIPRPFSQATIDEEVGTGEKEEEEEEEEEAEIVETPPPVPPKSIMRSLVPPPPLRFNSTVSRVSRASRTSISTMSSMSSLRSSAISNISSRSSTSFLSPKMPPTPNTPGTMGWDIAELPGSAKQPPTPTTPGTMGWDISELPGTEVTWDDVNHQKGEPFAIQHIRNSNLVLEESPLAASASATCLHLSVSCNVNGDTPEPTQFFKEPEIELLQCPPRGSMYSGGAVARRSSPTLAASLLYHSEHTSDIDFLTRAADETNDGDEPALREGCLPVISARSVLKRKSKKDIKTQRDMQTESNGQVQNISMTQNMMGSESAARPKSTKSRRNTRNPPECLKGEGSNALDFAYEAQEQHRLSRARYSLKRASAIFNPNPKLYVSMSDGRI